MNTFPIAALAAAALAGGGGVDRAQALIAANGGEGANGSEYDVTGWIEVGMGELMALESFCADIDLAGSPFRVVGFELRFDYFETVGDSSWASDVQITVTAPSGESYKIGGLTNQPDADILWSFDGPQSDDPGHYGDDGADIFLPWERDPQGLGDFTFVVANDWSGDPFANLYDPVEVRFYTVPVISCTGDIDGDGEVGFSDLLLMLTAWGPCLDCPEDLNDDDEVAFNDLLQLLFFWGPCE